MMAENTRELESMQTMNGAILSSTRQTTLSGLRLARNLRAGDGAPEDTTGALSEFL